MTKKTPSQIIGSLIQAAMSVNGVTVPRLAGMMKTHPNTIRADLHDPDRIPQSRVWLYFTVLGIPVQDALQSVAERFAQSITER